jgi:hypothetical protein
VCGIIRVDITELRVYHKCGAHMSIKSSLDNESESTFSFVLGTSMEPKSTRKRRRDPCFGKKEREIVIGTMHGK